MVEGHKELLPCNPTGDPKPEISWFYNNVRLDDDFDRFNFSIIEDGLLLEDVTKDHRGEYKCRAIQTSKLISHAAEKVFYVDLECKS